MPKRNEHLVVIMVQPVPEREFVVWPLHITVVPWFPVNDELKLDEILQKVASRHQAFDVSAGKTQQWGKKESFNVTLVNDGGSLHRLHLDVFHSLEKAGYPIHQKEYLGAEYQPHITQRNRRRREIADGEIIPVISFLLVEQLRQKKTGTMIKRAVKEYYLQ
ncbi:MAG TPA: 2'-5' RNA ligase family protein [Candidatus Saccharimonadales bacterium]|nr:2'-5' RNA ligase family protein [Candidatus Saccharimonadales bacterium]